MNKAQIMVHIRSLITSLKRKKQWSVTLVIGLSAGSLFFVYQASHLSNRIATLSEENQGLTQKIQLLTQKDRKLSYIYALATEFSMDPMIVTLVDHYAKEHMSKGGPEWRLVRTPEFMSYIMLSLIYAESKGDASAIGDGGEARGLTQLRVSTARDYGDVTAEQLHQPETNISFAFKHFQQLLQEYRGNLALTLYAWNRRSSKVDERLTNVELPQNGYAKRVYETALVNNRDLLINSFKSSTKEY
jgi:hypothetical protein